MRKKPIQKMWMFQLAALVLAVILAAWSPIGAGQTHPAQPESTPESQPNVSGSPTEMSESDELVGVWIPYLSLNLEEKTEEAFLSLIHI